MHELCGLIYSCAMRIVPYHAMCCCICYDITHTLCGACTPARMMWFTLFANLVTSHLACTSWAHGHGEHDLIKNDTPKYLSGLACMQADSNLGKLTTSHCQVLNTQNANGNMPNMFPIVYLNENLRYCNENLTWGK